MALPVNRISFIESCYELYEQKMFRVALSVLHDESLAEDAVQDAFLQLIKHKVFFPKADSDDCKRFIITVIKNASINIYNKRKNENKIVSFTENLEEVISSEAVEPDVESEDGAICTPLINSLPEKYQDVVLCLVVRDYSVKETADKLGISEANVRKRFERAKKPFISSAGSETVDTVVSETESPAYF